MQRDRAREDAGQGTENGERGTRGGGLGDGTGTALTGLAENSQSVLLGRKTKSKNGLIYKVR